MQSSDYLLMPYVNWELNDSDKKNLTIRHVLVLHPNYSCIVPHPFQVVVQVHQK